MFSLIAMAIAGGTPLYRYWPQFPPPEAIVRVVGPVSVEESFVLASLSGLAARRALLGGKREYVWIDVDRPAYRWWFADVREQAKPKMVLLPSVWGLLERFRQDQLVRGVIPFRVDRSARDLYSPGSYDPSANIATSLSPLLNAVAMPDSLLAKAGDLPIVADARQMSEAQALEATTKPTTIALIDPKTPVLRDMATAMACYTVASPSPTYGDALKRTPPDSPILGWGMGDEHQFTSLGSRHGAFQTASNWCTNLPLMASYRAKAAELRPKRQRSIWDLTWEDGVAYAAFLMSDGDNVQWLTSSFQDDGAGSWWSYKRRGVFPMGWTFCGVDLAQAAPAALKRLRSTATPNDDLVLMSGGYYYPDNYGADRPEDGALALHAGRVGAYLKEQQVAAFACLTDKWDSPAALRAYQTIANNAPSLAGFLPLQYAPYHAGLGRILWVGDKPAVSAHWAMWQGLGGANAGGPDEVAEGLNRLQPITGDVTEANFGWVTVHAWSRFPITGRSEPLSPMQAVDRAASKLAQHIRLVTPTDLLRLVALRMRPEPTLRRALVALSPSTPAAKGAKQRALALLSKRNYRLAFLSGKEAYRAQK